MVIILRHQFRVGYSDTPFVTSILKLKYQLSAISLLTASTSGGIGNLLIDGVFRVRPSNSANCHLVMERHTFERCIIEPVTTSAPPQLKKAAYCRFQGAVLLPQRCTVCIMDGVQSKDQLWVFTVAFTVSTPQADAYNSILNNFWVSCARSACLPRRTRLE